MKKSTQKSNLSKKIQTYSTMAAAVVAANQAAKAQGVVYTDVDPDETIGYGEQYSIDLNNDNVADFSVQMVSGTYTYMGFAVQYQLGAVISPVNQVNATTVFTYGTSSQAPKAYGPVVHNGGDTIDGNLDWQSGSFAMGADAKLLGSPLVSFGEWVGVTDKYASLKLVSGNDAYFGWVRMDMAADMSTITIKDFAYNSTAGNRLATGDTVDLGAGASIKEASLKNVSVYSFKNKVYVNSLNEALNEGTITISNTLGQTVYTSKFNESQTQIAIDEKGGNFYFVSVQTKDGVFTKKVFLKN